MGRMPVDWVKDFLVIYLVNTILVQLATERYKKYMRFFSGMLFLLFLAMPAARLLGAGGSMGIHGAYERFFEQLDAFGEMKPFVEEYTYGPQAYEQAVGSEIVRQAAEQGISVLDIQVHLKADYHIEEVEIRLEDRAKAEDKIRELLRRTYQLGDAQIRIR